MRYNLPLVVLHGTQTLAKFLMSEFSVYDCIGGELRAHEVVSLILHSLPVVY